MRAFRARAAKVTRQVQRTAERIASALYDAEDAGQGAALLGKLADLPSANPDDAVGGAVDALVAYRVELAALAREVKAIG